MSFGLISDYRDPNTDAQWISSSSGHASAIAAGSATAGAGHGIIRESVRHRFWKLAYMAVDGGRDLIYAGGALTRGEGAAWVLR